LKILINRIGGININAKHISVRAICSNQELKIDDMNPQLTCVLNIGNERIPCTMSSATRKRNGSYSLALKIKDSMKNVELLYPYHHKGNVDLTLMLYNGVDPETFQEADRMLQELSDKTGVHPSDILYNLTSFKNISGKRKLELVSRKQMLVIIDKMKEKLSSTSVEDKLT
jgi:hypothetical protein